MYELCDVLLIVAFTVLATEGVNLIFYFVRHYAEKKSGGKQ